MVVWSAIWSAVAGLAVIGVVMTASEVQSATRAEVYFRSSARLWALIGAVVAAMSSAVGPSVLQMGEFPASARGVVLGFFVVPSLVAVGVCLHSAASLLRVGRRRARALDRGALVDAVVVERERRALGHDLLSVTVEASMPVGEPEPHQGGYRAPAEVDGPQRRVQWVDTCPGEHWGRLSPGRAVRVRVDPRDPRCFALVLS